MTNDLITQRTELEQLKRMVTDDLTSTYSRVMYAKALDDFLAWYESTGKRGLTKEVAVS